MSTSAGTGHTSRGDNSAAAEEKASSVTPCLGVSTGARYSHAAFSGRMRDRCRGGVQYPQSPAEGRTCVYYYFHAHVFQLMVGLSKFRERHESQGG